MDKVIFDNDYIQSLKKCCALSTQLKKEQNIDYPINYCKILENVNFYTNKVDIPNPYQHVAKLYKMVHLKKREQEKEQEYANIFIFLEMIMITLLLLLTINKIPNVYISQNDKNLCSIFICSLLIIFFFGFLLNIVFYFDIES